MDTEPNDTFSLGHFCPLNSSVS